MTVRHISQRLPSEKEYEKELLKEKKWDEGVIWGKSFDHLVTEINTPESVRIAKQRSGRPAEVKRRMAFRKAKNLRGFQNEVRKEVLEIMKDPSFDSYVRS